mmetsp:Transcript_17300/g.56229  ORF Transcript_17300/g.56229 Transcript_17300/m.56229 type:complete len:95 (+) Transcript_17300:191-475(+)
MSVNSSPGDDDHMVPYGSSQDDDAERPAPLTAQYSESPPAVTPGPSNFVTAGPPTDLDDAAVRGGDRRRTSTTTEDEGARPRRGGGDVSNFPRR